MDTRQMNALIGTMVMASLMFAMPGLATDERVTVITYFNIAVVDELSVTLLGDSAVLSAAGGTATTNNIEYNFTKLTQTWTNATRTGSGGSEQDSGNPILSLDNTGTTNLTLKMNYTATLVGSCFAVRYAQSWVDVGALDNANTTDVDTAAVTINASYLPADSALSIWLYANATSCTSTGAATSRTLTIWAIRDP